MGILNKKDQPLKKQQIDLTGPDGNAFVLLGKAKSFSGDLGLDADQVMEEMKSGDYENLITVFDKYFGDHIDLLR